MRTEILHYNTANEYILNHALSLSDRNVEEDEQRCQDKKKNALLLAKKILALLTPKQRGCYLRYYVDGKLVTEIAKEDNIGISCAYDCIKRAGAEFTKAIILAKLSPEQQSIIEKFDQVLNDRSLITHLIVVDYYINAMTAEEIADKINASRKREWKVSAIREKIRDIGGLFSRNGIPESDLKALRKFLKDKSKEQTDI